MRIVNTDQFFRENRFFFEFRDFCSLDFSRLEKGPHQPKYGPDCSIVINIF